MAEQELKLINDRVLRGSRKRLPKKPIDAHQSGRPDQKAMIENVADLMEAGDSEDVCSAIISRLRMSASMRYAVEDDWYFAVRAYFQQFTEEREDSWESDRYLPYILKQVETALPSIVAATLDEKHGLFRCTGKTRKGKNAAKANEALINHQAETHDFAEEYERLYWWAALLGTGYLDHGWDQRTEKRWVPVVKQDEQGNPYKDFEEQDVVVADHPFPEALNPLDVYPADTGRMGDDTDWYILRVETTIGDLRELAEPEDGHDEPTHMDGPALERWISETNPADMRGDEATWFDGIASGATWTDWLSELGLEREGDGDENDDTLSSERRVVVLVYRSKWETVTMGSPKHIIGYSRNKNIHGKTGIVCHQFFEVPHFPWGRGIGTILRGHQELMNENINRWMDTAAIEAMAPILVDKSRANLLDDELEIQPNAIIRTRGVDAVKRMELPAPTALAMQMDGHLARDADDLTGFSEQARGMAPGDGQTATAFTGLQSNIRTRLIMHVRRSGRTLKRSGRLMVMLNQQYLTKEEVVQRIGDDGLEYVEVQPHEIVGEVSVSVSLSASRAAPEMRAQRLLQLFQLMVPVLQGGLLQQPQVRRLVRMIFEANEIEDVDLLIPKGGDQKKDAGVENILLEQLTPIDPHPSEPHDVHIQAHTMRMRELAQDEVDHAVLEAFNAHIRKHAEMQAQQAQQQMAAAQQGQGTPAQQAQGASGAGIGAGGGSETRQGATLASAATGGQGTPGVAAPGPSAPGRQG